MSTGSTATRSAWPIYVGALVMIGVFLVIALLLRGIAPSGATDEVEKAEVRRTNLATLNESDQAEMTAYGWVDREKGIVRVPIEDAMAKEIETLNRQKPRAAYAIATPPPAPAADPTEGSAETVDDEAATESASLAAAPSEKEAVPEESFVPAEAEAVPVAGPTPGAPGAEPAESATPAPTSDQS